MIVGFISEEVYCKAQLQRVRALGHQAECLGGAATSFPPRFDLIVVRTSACSHRASDAALKAKRGGRNVLFEDSVTGILEHLDQENGGSTMATTAFDAYPESLRHKKAWVRRTIWDLLGASPLRYTDIVLAVKAHENTVSTSIREMVKLGLIYRSVESGLYQRKEAKVAAVSAAKPAEPKSVVEPAETGPFDAYPEPLREKLAVTRRRVWDLLAGGGYPQQPSRRSST